MIGIDLLSIGVALAPMAKTFHANLSVLQWLVTAFAMGNAAFLVASGHLSDVYGRKQILIIGIVLFTLSSLAIAVLNNIYWEIAARFLQGASGGIMVTSAIATIMSILPEDKKPKWVGAMVGAAGLGMAVGPMIGGILVHYISWRAIFFINVPIGISAVLATLSAVPFMEKHKGMHLDAGGILFICMFLVSLTIIISESHIWGFTSVAIISLSIVCVVSLVFLYFIESKHASPLLNFSVFTTKDFLAANLLGFCIYAGLTSYLLIWGLYFEKLYNSSAVMVAMYLLPIGILMFVCSVMSDVLTKHLSKLQSARWGSLFCALSALGLGLSRVDTSYMYFAFAFALYGLGFYLVNSVTIPLAITNVEKKHIGVASGIAMMLRWFGGAVGSAVSAVIFEVTAKNRIGDHGNAVQLFQSVVGHKNLQSLAKTHSNLLHIQHYYNMVLNVSMSHCMFFVAILLLISFLSSLIFIRSS